MTHNNNEFDQLFRSKLEQAEIAPTAGAFENVLAGTTAGNAGLLAKLSLYLPWLGGSAGILALAALAYLMIPASTETDVLSQTNTPAATVEMSQSTTGFTSHVDGSKATPNSTDGTSATPTESYTAPTSALPQQTGNSSAPELGKGPDKALATSTSTDQQQERNQAGSAQSNPQHTAAQPGGSNQAIGLTSATTATQPTTAIEGIGGAQHSKAAATAGQREERNATGNREVQQGSNTSTYTTAAMAAGTTEARPTSNGSQSDREANPGQPSRAVATAALAEGRPQNAQNALVAASDNEMTAEHELRPADDSQAVQANPSNASDPLQEMAAATQTDASTANATSTTTSAEGQASPPVQTNDQPEGDQPMATVDGTDNASASNEAPATDSAREFPHSSPTMPAGKEKPSRFAISANYVRAYNDIGSNTHHTTLQLDKVMVIERNAWTGNAGLGMHYSLTDHWTVTTGLSYNLITRSFIAGYMKPDTFVHASVGEPQIEVTCPEIETAFGVYTTDCYSEENEIVEGTHKQSYLSVPLLAEYMHASTRFRLRPAAGVVANFRLPGSYEVTTTRGTVESTSSMLAKTLSLRANVSAGYAISNRFEVYGSLGVDAGFTRFTTTTGAKWHRIMTGIGTRFHI